MSSGATIPAMCWPLSPPHVRYTSSEHVSGARGRGQHAVRLDLGVEPGRAVRIRGRDDERPRRMPAGEALDDRRGALADLAAARR